MSKRPKLSPDVSAPAAHIPSQSFEVPSGTVPPFVASASGTSAPNGSKTSHRDPTADGGGQLVNAPAAASASWIAAPRTPAPAAASTLSAPIRASVASSSTSAPHSLPASFNAQPSSSLSSASVASSLQPPTVGRSGASFSSPSVASLRAAYSRTATRATSVDRAAMVAPPTAAARATVRRSSETNWHKRKRGQPVMAAPYDDTSQGFFQIVPSKLIERIEGIPTIHLKNEPMRKWYIYLRPHTSNKTSSFTFELQGDDGKRIGVVWGGLMGTGKWKLDLTPYKVQINNQGNARFEMFRVVATPEEAREDHAYTRQVMMFFRSRVSGGAQNQYVGSHYFGPLKPMQPTYFETCVKQMDEDGGVIAPKVLVTAEYPDVKKLLKKDRDGKHSDFKPFAYRSDVERALPRGRRRRTRVEPMNFGLHVSSPGMYGSDPDVPLYWHLNTGASTVLPERMANRASLQNGRTLRALPRMATAVPARQRWPVPTPGREPSVRTAFSPPGSYGYMMPRSGVYGPPNTAYSSAAASELHRQAVPQVYSQYSMGMWYPPPQHGPPPPSPYGMVPYMGMGGGPSPALPPRAVSRSAPRTVPVSLVDTSSSSSSATTQ